MKRLAFIAFALIGTPAIGQTVAGTATVIDGDSLSVAGVSIRLFGIDAPEGKQTCDRDEVAWRCGEEAASQLRGMIGSSPVLCQGRGNDTYGRTVAVCSVAGIELNRAMVEAGWATAFRRYSEDYLAEETRARAARRGIWGSTFVLPQDFRAAQRASQAVAAPIARSSTRDIAATQGSSGCAIKGNRNRRGQWIYHLPGMPYYEATRAEEIFCSEAQARAAGYRRAIVR